MSDKIYEHKGNSLKLTNYDKEYFPESGYTKGDIADYYNSIAEFIIPHLEDRPHSLHRHPNGVDGKNFFQKDVGDMPPDFINTRKLKAETKDKKINYLVCRSKLDLLYMVQLGCIELHPWLSRLGSINKPDYAVLDLDREEAEFKDAITVAKTIKKIADTIDVTCYCKTSGSKGLHIYIMLDDTATYKASKNFMQLLAKAAAVELPELTSLSRSPEKRKNKIYLDYLQNKKAQTIVAPYSVRPKPGATVATLLEWSEVNKKLSIDDFTIESIPERLEKKGEKINKDFFQAERTDLKKAEKKLKEKYDL